MELARKVELSVAKAVQGEAVVAVAFSGGLDSSILARCAIGQAKVIACTAYSEGARDSFRAKLAADTLGIGLVTTRITAERVAAELAGIHLPFEPTLMDRSLWCLYSFVGKSAWDSGAKSILLGQLADELFGGYAKYEEGLRLGGEERARLMMDADVKEYALRGRIRDVGACSRWLPPKLPFGEKEMVEFGTSLPVSYKIRGGVRKAILRRAAVMLGVPEELAGAAKKAAQYSSGVQKLVAGSHF